MYFYDTQFITKINKYYIILFNHIILNLANQLFMESVQFDTDMNFWSGMYVHINECDDSFKHMCFTCSHWLCSSRGNGSAQDNQSRRWKAPTHFPDGDAIVLWQQWHVFIKLFYNISSAIISQRLFKAYCVAIASSCRTR